MDNYPHFSDFANEPKPLEGEKVKISDVINQQILITDFDIKPSRYKKNNSGKYLTLQFQYNKDDKPKVIFTGSDVLIDQLERYKDKVPFWSVIKKINRYYILT